MRCNQLARYSDSELKRLIGVPQPLYREMVEVLAHAKNLKCKSGRPHTLSLEYKLTLTINYLKRHCT